MSSNNKKLRVEIYSLWNKFLNKIQLPEYKICTVNIAFNHICGKYIKKNERFCKIHKKEYNMLWREYHLYNCKEYYEKMGLHIYDIIEIEINQRLSFERKFNLGRDYGHHQWLEFLYNKLEDVNYCYSQGYDSYIEQLNYENIIKDVRFLFLLDNL